MTHAARMPSADTIASCRCIARKGSSAGSKRRCSTATTASSDRGARFSTRVTASSPYSALPSPFVLAYRLAATSFASAERSGSASVVAASFHSPSSWRPRNETSRPVWLLQLLRERVVDLEAGDHPGNRQRRHHRDDRELVELTADRRDPGGLLRRGGAVEELREPDPATDFGFERRRDHPMVGPDQHHQRGTDSLALLREHRRQRVAVVCGDAIAERGFGGERRACPSAIRCVSRSSRRSNARAPVATSALTVRRTELAPTVAISAKAPTWISTIRTSTDARSGYGGCAATGTGGEARRTLWSTI